jgi:hypothetical protein
VPTDGTTNAEDAMTTTRKHTSRTFTLIGAGAGLAAFLAIGLLPSILYGGYAGVLLAGGILGTPVEASFAARAFIVAGMVIGVGTAGAFFAALGAAAGASVAALTRSRKVATAVEAASPVEPKP